MARKMVDCRTIPNDVGCTLTIAGEEAELLEAAVSHAVTVHDDTDTPELRRQVKAAMVSAEPALA